MKVDVCICDQDECNRKMGEIETSSKSPETTSKGKNNEGFKSSCFSKSEVLNHSIS